MNQHDKGFFFILACMITAHLPGEKTWLDLLTIGVFMVLAISNIMTTKSSKP
jgi:hypothetical protein